MNRVHILLAAAGLALAAASAAAWLLYLPTPDDTPYFHWQRGADDRYELRVDHVGGNPEFRRGVTTPPVPQSGTLRVVGGNGAADPGALVEVSNPRTGRGYRATADAGGAFAVDAEVRRGDTLRVISRRVQFRIAQPPRAGPVVD